MTIAVINMLSKRNVHVVNLYLIVLTKLIHSFKLRYCVHTVTKAYTHAHRKIPKHETFFFVLSSMVFMIWKQDRPYTHKYTRDSSITLKQFMCTCVFKCLDSMKQGVPRFFNSYWRDVCVISLTIAFSRIDNILSNLNLLQYPSDKLIQF